MGEDFNEDLDKGILRDEDVELLAMGHRMGSQERDFEEEESEEDPHYIFLFFSTNHKKGGGVRGVGKQRTQALVLKSNSVKYKSMLDILVDKVIFCGFIFAHHPPYTLPHVYPSRSSVCTSGHCSDSNAYMYQYQLYCSQ